MKNNKFIIDNCPNFYKIKNYLCDPDDLVTNRLITVYENYIFDIDINNIDDVKRIKKIDHILYKYLTDYNLRKNIKDGIINFKIKSSENIIDIIVNRIFELFESYEEGLTRNIYFARWI